MKVLPFYCSWLFILLTLFPCQAISQVTIGISGKVTDKSSGETIPYCNISILSATSGTASNELGEFSINIDSLPKKLIFSHINYGQQIVEVSAPADLVISLEPLAMNLDEVVVRAAKQDGFAMTIAKKAIAKVIESQPKKNYARAFYRQKTKNGENYAEFSEIFYDIRYSSSGIDDWNIFEGRYALKNEAVRNKNFTAFSRFLKPLQPDTEELIFPLHPNLEVYYNVEVIDIIESEDDQIAIVKFDPKDQDKSPKFKGEVYINTKTFEVLKIIGSLARDDLALVKLATKDSYWKNYNIGFEITYKKDANSQLVLDFINVEQAFDYYKNDSFQYRTATLSNLTFYEHYSPTSRKRLGGSLQRNKSDWQNLDDIGYNEQFWIDNPVVRRTPVEEEVISAFERDNAFNSIFLNSTENIAILASNLARDTFIKELNENTNLYNDYNPVEKVYLHTDKELYAGGETLWFSGYAVVGPYHQFTGASKVLHIDLIGPKSNLVAAQTKELVEGKASGVIELPKSLPRGIYQLRSYTQWMRNFDPDFFFTKTIEILGDAPVKQNKVTAEQKIDIQFLPEGGHLVAGLASKVGFRATDDQGSELVVKGQVLNSKGKSVAAFSTFDRGAGFFQIIPKYGEEYTVQLSDGSKYPFPKILNDGYTMTVNNLNPKNIRVIVQASKSLQKANFYVVGHVRQRRYYQSKLEFDDTGKLSFEIPKSNMPSGVLTLTLFDQNRKPRSERPVFVNNQDALVITSKVNSENLVKRSKIKLDLKVTDAFGRPVSANLSIAVSDKGQVNKTNDAGTILTELLLQSELSGEITNPGSLFKNEERPTLNQLDLIMLTHGWRKFPWQEVWQKQKVKKEYRFSKGLKLSGTAKTPFGKPLSNSLLHIIAKSGDDVGMYSTTSEPTGSFSIDNFNFEGNTELVFNAFNQKSKAVDVKIDLDKNPIRIPPSTFESPLVPTQTQETQEYLNTAKTRNRFNTLYDFDKVTALDEVVITDKKIKKSRNESPSTYGQTPDATVYADDYTGFQTVLQLVALFNGVTVSGNTVSIRNQGTPLWVLNGIPISNENPSANEQAIANQRANGGAISLSMEQSLAANPAPAFIATMDTFAVERLEILKGPSAAIYGSRGANGVILIYTKKGTGTAPILAPDFTVEGHNATRAFYSPKYDIKEDRHVAPDYRATLYWNPNITTDSEGKASVEFFNSDTANEIQITVEGLSSQGIPGTYLKTFGSKK